MYSVYSPRLGVFSVGGDLQTDCAAYRLREKVTNANMIDIIDIILIVFEYLI